MVLQVTANLAVDRIEPSADFFAKIGFEMNIQVPEGDHIGFAILQHGVNQVMFQTRTSLLQDSDAFAAAAVAAPVMLYITVKDLNAIAKRLRDYDIAMPERTTFYGAREIGYREPGGHIVTFAQFADQGEEPED